jgi:glycosyltransferase involved in cell wall biosynthesis
MKSNITYIVSNINKALAFEWIATHLNRQDINLRFILLNPGESELEVFLKEHDFKVDRITYTGKKDILLSILKTIKILKQNKTTIVHTHLFDANIVGLTAAWLAGIPKRIQTRHHSDFHHVYHPKAVKYDKYANRLSTDIIAISEVVREVLIHEGTSQRKIQLIHHGFLLEEFTEKTSASANTIAKKYNPDNRGPVVGIISRYTEWKGIQYIIPAFKELLTDYPDALLVLANAKGNYKEEIQRMLQSLPAKNYIEIPFESDIFSLYKLFDIFIHVPITEQSEAFGQTYVEALAMGIPSIFTLSGVAKEFITDHHNAVVVDYKNSEEIYTSIHLLLNNKPLANVIRINGKTDVNKFFGLDKMILSLESLYRS